MSELGDLRDIRDGLIAINKLVAEKDAEIARLREMTQQMGVQITEADAGHAKALTEVERLRGVIAAVEVMAQAWAAGEGPTAFTRIEHIRAYLAEAAE